MHTARFSLLTVATMSQPLMPLWRVCLTRIIPVGFAVGAAMEFAMCKAGFCESLAGAVLSGESSRVY